MRKQTYVVLFQDQSQVYCQSLDNVIDYLDELDGLNVTQYFEEFRPYPYQALDRDGDLCIVSAE